MNSKTAFVPADRATRVQLPHCVLEWLCHGDQSPTEALSLGIATFAQGGGHGRHVHPNAEEIIYVLRGTAMQGLGEETFAMRPGDAIHIPQGAVHSTQNTGQGDLAIIVVFTNGHPETVDL